MALIVDDGQGAGTVTDRQLLECFVSNRDEAAFTSLVQRHSGMVWSACRRLLEREQDVEDAFQAVFMVLARKAASIRQAEAVGSWLYGVAYKVATRLRRSAAHRQEQERKATARLEYGKPWDELALRELQRLVDEELQRLSEKYRAPFILCCLEGMSRSDAARELGLKEGTLSGRLAFARKTLQSRLTRRGITLTTLLTLGALSSSKATAAPALLVQGTADAALAPLTGKTAATTLSPAARSMAEDYCRTSVFGAVIKGAALLVALAALPVGLAIGWQALAQGGEQNAWDHRPWPAAWIEQNVEPIAEAKTPSSEKPDTNGPKILANLKPRAAYRDHFERTFLGQTEKDPDLELFGLDVEEGVRFEPAGIRIALPPGYQDERPRTGIATGFGLAGDFDVTVSYEVLREPDPADSPKQTRLTLALPSETPKEAFATLSRTVMPKKGTHFLTSMTRQDTASGTAQQQANLHAATAKSGRLRLVRSGALLLYFASDGRDADFQLLDQWLFGPSRVNEVRVVGSTGGPLAGLDFRITAMSIHADSLRDDLFSESPQLERSIWLTLASLVGFLLLSAAAFATRRNRRHAPAADVNAAAAMLSFVCPSCAKNLKAKSALVGKPVRCPHCGGEVTVPAPQSTDSRPGRSARRYWPMIVAAVAGMAALALIVGLALFLWLRPTSADYLNRSFGAESVEEIDETGVWHTEYTKKFGEPFRWTNGDAKFVVPLNERRPLALEVRIGVPIPKPFKRLCVRVNGKSLFDEPVNMPYEWSHVFDVSRMDLGREATIEVISDSVLVTNNDNRRLGVCVRGITLIGGENRRR